MILFLVTTVGEDITFEALNALNKYTPSIDSNLRIWYDACGRDIDWKFYEMLKVYTSDIILSTVNQGVTQIVGSQLVYSNYDYLIHICCDFIVKPNYFNILMEPFSKIDKLALVGEGFRDFKEEMIVSDPNILSDGVCVYSRKAVNEIGSVSAQFWNNAPSHQEWQRRALVNGWNISVVKDICRHGGTQHEGINKLGKDAVHKMMDENSRKYLKMEMMGYKDYNWYSNVIEKEEVHAT